MHKIHNSKFDFRLGCPDTAGGVDQGMKLQDWTLTDGYLYHQKSNNKLYESFAHIEFNAK